ncbi:cell surface protein [Streptosporangium nondiastaticum]|uniref:Cell surface protein n=1 Tax=Streptosporangium nondiastaticum TaxID=35764 RepID=A0A9X7JP65_9ACTN|nr:cell surface protein [Streptosporangium nondiastaticum]PSJ27091.1 cell surface protein [Streptosporangium nondiastaticum]
MSETPGTTDLTPAGINAAFSVPDSGGAPAAVYMLRGGWAVHYDAASTAPPQRGNTLRELWPQLPSAYLGGVDATCSTDTQRVYFFKGSTCVLYDIAKNEPVGGSAPVQIGDKFPGLGKDAPDFTQGVDAGMAASDGTVYLFRGGRFVNYDLQTDEVLEQGTLEEGWANADYPDSGVYGGVAAAFNHPATRNGYLIAPDGKRYAECDTDPDAHRVTSGTKALRDRWPYRTFVGVVDDTAGILWVFDAATGQKIRQTQVGSYPGGVAISPDGFLALTPIKATSGTNGSLTLVDITSGAPKSVPLQDQWPYRVAVAPDGSAACVATVFGTAVHVVDPTSGAVRSVEIGEEASCVVAAPDSSCFYVSCRSAGDVAVVDPVTATVTRRFDGGSKPTELALTPDGSVLGITNPSSGSSFVMIARTVGGGQPIPVGVGRDLMAVAASPDSQQLYSVDLDSKVKVIDIPSATHVGDIAGLPDRRLSSVAVSPDGQHLFVTGYLGTSVQKLPVGGGDPVEFPLGLTLTQYAYVTVAPAWG